MKKLQLLLLFLLSSFELSAEISESKTIKNLDITVTGEYKVEIYKDEKHMFSYDCRPYMFCEIFTTTKNDPSYKMFDGKVHSSDDLKTLTIDNIEEVVGNNPNFYDGNILFFITTSSPTASYGTITMYTINTDEGSVQVRSTEYDWFRSGMDKPKIDNSCINLKYCKEINLCKNQNKSYSKIYEFNIQDNGNASAQADFNNDGILDNFVILEGDSDYCGSGGCHNILYLGGNNERCYTTNLTNAGDGAYFAFEEFQKNGIKSIIRTDSNGKPICSLTRDRKNERWVKANERNFFDKINCEVVE